MSRPRYSLEQTPGAPGAAPALYQVVRINNPRERSAPMELAAAQREADHQNAFFARLDEEEGPWGGEYWEVAD